MTVQTFFIFQLFFTLLRTKNPKKTLNYIFALFLYSAHYNIVSPFVILTKMYFSLGKYLSKV